MLAYYILLGVDPFAEHLQQWYYTQFPSVMLISGLPEACSFPSRPSKRVYRWCAEIECIPPPHHLQLQPMSSVELHNAHKSLDNCLFEFNKLFTHVNGIFPAVWAPPWNFISSSSPHPWPHCEPPMKYLHHNPIFAWVSSYSLSMFMLMGHQKVYNGAVLCSDIQVISQHRYATMPQLLYTWQSLYPKIVRRIVSSLRGITFSMV